MKMKFNIQKGFVYTLLLMGTLSFAACNNSAKISANEQPEIDSKSPITEVENNGENLTFVDVNGKSVDLKSLEGKVVFINFWATWCQPCIQEMPSINQLKNSFSDNDDIVFLMVDVNNTIKKSQDFMDKRKYNLKVYTPTTDVPTTFLGNAIPTTIVLSKKGEIAARIEGGMDYASPEIAKFLQELLATK